MTIQQAKQIQITDFLSCLGNEPERKRGREFIYLAPHRAEKSASFSVNIIKNCFYDYGTGETGDIITLALLIISKNKVSDALTFIEQIVNNPFSSCQQNFNKENKSSKIGIYEPNKIEIYKTKKIGHNAAITQYIESRQIRFSLAELFCTEVYYSLNDKIYFGAGFKNDAGGYEIRNKYFKTSTSPKTITTFKISSNNCLVFEGFFDFLSFLTLNNLSYPANDIIVLNSLANITHASSLLENYSTIKLYLDNDEAGVKLTQKLISSSNKIIDCSSLYRDYKDINEFLIGKKFCVT